MINNLVSSKIVKNAGWIIGCKLVKAVLTLVTTMLISRHLGVADYGLLSYAAGLVAFAAPVMRLGLDSVLVHNYVTEPEAEGEIMGTAMVLNLLAAGVSVIGVTCFAFFVNRHEESTVLICFLYSLMLLFQSMEMIYYWFHAKMLAKYSAIAMLIAYVFVAAVQCIMVFCGAGVCFFALSHSLDFFLIFLILFLVYKKKSEKPISFSLHRAKSLLSVSRYYIIADLMVVIFAQTDRIMLKLMIGNESVGLYTAATTCAGMVSFVFAAIIDSMRPGIFEGMKSSEFLFEKRLKQLYCIVIYFSFFVSFIMTIFSPLIVFIFYGQQYYDASYALRIVVWYTTFSYIGTIKNIWILAYNQQRYLLWINGIGAMSNIILNLILIPHWGICGAAVASLFTQFFTNVVIGFFVPPLCRGNWLMLQSLNPKNLFIDSSEKK